MEILYDPADYPDSLRCITEKGYDDGNQSRVRITQADSRVIFRYVATPAIRSWASIAPHPPIEPIDPWFTRENLHRGYDQVDCCVIGLEGDGNVAVIYIPTMPTPTVLEVTACTVISNGRYQNGYTPPEACAPYVQPEISDVFAAC